MKIACIGNVRQVLFTLSRFLKDLNYDVTLFIYPEDHFLLPSADCYDDSYAAYTEYMNWLPQNFYRVNGSEIRKRLEKYEFIICSARVPAFLNKAGLKVDIFVPHGSDIYKAPFYNISKFPTARKIKNKILAENQRKGILNSDHIFYDRTNREQEALLAQLNYQGNRIEKAPPMIYTKQYHPEAIKEYYKSSKYFSTFKKIRDENELVIFHHVRQCWKKKDDDIANFFGNKGNDILFRGFAGFVHHNSAIKAKLLLFESGPDVVDSRELIKDLKIEDKVVWFPVMERKELMIGIRLSDIGIAELSHSWLSYCAIFEFLAMAKPVITFRDDSLYVGLYPELYPVINVSTSAGIEESLSNYLANPGQYREMGNRAQKWFYRYGIQEPMDEFIRIIEDKK
jgi:hypothetical protein